MVTFVLFLLTNSFPTPWRDVTMRMQRNSWGGVGGYVTGDMLTFMRLAHMEDAMQLFLWGMLTFHELGHTVNATCIYVVGW